MWPTGTEEDFLNGEEISRLDLNPPNVPPSDPDEPVPAALKGEEEAHIYEHYSFNHEYSPDLPITHYQQDIVNTIESNSVCVIHGKDNSYFNLLFIVSVLQSIQ